MRGDSHRRLFLGELGLYVEKVGSEGEILEYTEFGGREVFGL